PDRRIRGRDNQTDSAKGRRRQEGSMQNELIIPQAPESERAIIGAILLNPVLLGEVRGQLTSGMFFTRSHREAYEALLALHDKRLSIDPLQLIEELRERSVLELVGTPAEISRNYIDGALPSEIGSHVRRVLEAATRRAIWSSVMQAASEVNDGQPLEK